MDGAPEMCEHAGMITSLDLFDKLFRKLPSWAKAVFWVLAFIGSLVVIAREGLGRFLLKVIFSP